MNPVKMLAVGQILTALALAVVGLFALQSNTEVKAVRGELAETQERLVLVETERDGLRARVTALEAALIAAGVDPKTVDIQPAPPAEPSQGGTSAPAPRDTPSVSRPPASEPAPQPAPAPQAPQPAPEPPTQEPDPEPSTCVAIVCLPL